MTSLENFRAEVRGFLHESVPRDLIDAVRAHCVLSREQAKRMQLILYGKGWAAPSWSKEHGGTGWSLSQQAIFKEELALSGAPLLENLGIETIGPTLIRHGTSEQQKHFLPRILTFEDYWAQCYSEPGAGSDLAALSTTATRDGEHLVVNGTKLWQSYGHWANWALVLVRTEPSAVPRQAGISVLLVDLKSPGVTVTPIRLMNGAYFHAQMFFDGVRVPMRNLVGQVNAGWSVAKSLLVAERLFTARVAECQAELRKLKELSNNRAQSKSLFTCDRFAAQYAQLDIGFRSLEAAWWPVLRAAEVGEEPELEASLLKWQGSELLQEIQQVQLQAAGLQAVPFDAEAVNGLVSTAPFSSSHAENLPLLIWRFRGASLGGGSFEVQRQILAKALFSSSAPVDRVGRDGRSQEQQMLADSTRRLLAAHGGFEARSKMIEQGHPSNSACWHALAAMGLLGLLVPEGDGGSGLIASDLLAPMEAMGEALSVEPVVWSAVLCTQIYVDGVDFSHRSERLKGLICGKLRVAASLADLEETSSCMDVQPVVARCEQGQWYLRGETRLLMGGDGADMFLIAATIGTDEFGIFEVPAGTAGVHTRNYRCHDGRRAVDLSMRDVHLPKDALVARSRHAKAALKRAARLTTLALSADTIGAMRGALLLTIDYMRTRKQFGQALSEFQALRHRVVEHYRNLFYSYALVAKAADSWNSSDDSEQLRALSAAKWASGRYGRALGLDAIQLHGAIGMQNEAKISHYAQRLVANDTLLGHSDHHLGKLASASRSQWLGRV